MINPQWLELPMPRTNLHGPKDVRVRLDNQSVAMVNPLIPSGFAYLPLLAVYS